MADPLGVVPSLGSRLFWFISAFFSLAAAPSFAHEVSCADQIVVLVERSIHSIAQQRPVKSAAKIRKKHAQLHEKITDRVRARCPRPESCTSTQLALIVAQVTEDAITRELHKPAWWRVYPLFALALAGGTALNMAADQFVDSKVVAASLSTLVTVMSVLTIEHLGASSLERPFSHIRLWGYQQTASEDLNGLRGSAQRRLNEIYVTTQQLFTFIEEEARATDRQAKMQQVVAQIDCKPFAGESKEAFLERAANVFAKLLSDLVPLYPELEFAEHDYADWAKVTFSEWFLNDENRELFRKRVLQLISARYDEDVQPDTKLWRDYESALYNWTAPLPPVPAP